MNLEHWHLIPVAIVFMSMFSISPQIFAWHENLGIDSSKAAELYQTKPSDPAIVQWKNALQSAINDMGHCFDVSVISCESYMSTIINNCKFHPNELLACNDLRLAQYPAILKQAQEEQEKIAQAKKNAEEAQVKNLTLAYSTKINETRASLIIDGCKKSSNPVPKFEVTDSSCPAKLSSLQQDCQKVIVPYDYCKDGWFVGYLNSVNQTKSNSEEQGCSGRLHTMTSGKQICVIPS